MSKDPYVDLDPIGLRALDAVRSRLVSDPQWTLDHADGFSWWSHRLRQTFRVEGPIELSGVPTWWLSFETDVASGLVGPDDRKGLVAQMANRVSNLYATVVDGDRLVHRGRVSFQPETLPHRAQLLSDRALLSNTDAHLIADTFVQHASSVGLEIDGLRVAESAHPIAGPRSEPDPILRVRDDVFVAQGKEDPPPERTPDLDDAARSLESVRRDDMSIRLNERRPRSLTVGLVAAHGFAAYQLMNGVRHPILGLGTLSLLRVVPTRESQRTGLPTSDELPSAPEAARICERLDAAEWKAWAPLLSIGAWVPDRFGDNDDLAYAYATFHPNACVVPSVAHELANDAVQRFAWTAPFLVSRDAVLN